jgi:hypothetical protein
MLIAMTAGGLFASACKKNESNGSSSGSTTGNTAAPAEKTAKVHCMGVNECKGKGGCKTAANACAGQNGCKGQGFNDMTETECKDKGGTVLAAAP